MAPKLSKLCSVKYCKALVDDDKQRCLCCNSLRMRLARAVDASPAEAKDKFKAQLPIDRETFLQDCQGLYGDDLVKMVTSRFAVSRTAQTEVKLQGAGNFMDSPDLRESTNRNQSGWKPF